MSRKRKLSGPAKISLLADALGEKYSEFGIPTSISFMESEMSYEEVLAGVRTMCRRKKNFKFRCRITKDYKKMVEIPNFCDEHLENHIFTQQINGDSELLLLVEELFVKPFDFELPPWDITIIRGHSRGTVVVIRIHHCIGDGFSVGVAEMAMFKEETECMDMLLKKFAFTKKLSFKLGMYFWIIWNFFAVIFVLIWAFLFKKDNKEAFLKGKKLTGKKRVNFLWNWDQDDPKGLNLQASKKIAKNQHKKMTINDFYTALLSYAATKHFGVKEQCYTRVSLPVNVRMTPVTNGPNNEFGATFLDIPLGEMSWEKRVKLTMKSTAFMKKYPIQYYTYYSGKFFSWLPDSILKWIFKKSTSLQSIQMSNVAGAPIKVHVGNSGQMDCSFLVPLVAGTVFTIGVLSYNNQMSVSLVTDGVVDDPELFLKHMKEKYIELANETFVGK